MDDGLKESLVETNSDPLIRKLNQIVVVGVKFLAILMVFVIFWGLVDVLIVLYVELTQKIDSIFYFEHLLRIFGSFLAVLIAIEIFLNIIFYLKKDAIHVPLVLATALTAVARKVIILDYTNSDPSLFYATASVILAVGVSYWLVTKKSTV